ncbi:MAG: thioesterase family protein [Myxococcales bacterium]|nr:thioesterase family protein [Myxococcales bacterium]
MPVPMPMTDAAFFLPDGDAFIATPHTRGPWSDQHQHGGPGAALLAAAFERAVAPLQVARMTLELLRPIPIGRVTLELGELKPGARTRLHGASLRVDGQEVCRATCLAIRTKDLPLPRATAAAVAPPQAAAPVTFPFFMHPVGYHTAMELRIAEGAIGEGRATAWLRMRMPLVLGQPTSPLCRVAIAADSGNGVSARLDWRRWLFINPDLTIHVHRVPRGEWVGLEAITEVEPHGIGLAASVLHDEDGPLGRGLQSLYIDAHA